MKNLRPGTGVARRSSGAGRSLLSYAALLQLDVPLFTTDVATHVHERRVQDDFMSGVQSGVNGTPTFFINGIRYDGRRDVASMLRRLKDVLRKVQIEAGERM